MYGQSEDNVQVLSYRCVAGVSLRLSSLEASACWATVWPGPELTSDHSLTNSAAKTQSRAQRFRCCGNQWKGKSVTKSPSCKSIFLMAIGTKLLNSLFHLCLLMIKINTTCILPLRSDNYKRQEGTIQGNRATYINICATHNNSSRFNLQDLYCHEKHN